MKKHRMILCALLVLTMVASAVVISMAKTSYELKDGAVVFNSNNTVSYLANGGSVNNVAISYDASENAKSRSQTLLLGSAAFSSV